jgi:(2Fe-2S) ferredoxin
MKTPLKVSHPSGLKETLDIFDIRDSKGNNIIEYADSEWATGFNKADAEQIVKAVTLFDELVEALDRTIQLLNDFLPTYVPCSYGIEDFKTDFAKELELLKRAKEE